MQNTAMLDHEPLYRVGDRVRWSIDHTPFRRIGQVESVVEDEPVEYIVKFVDGGVMRLREDQILPHGWTFSIWSKV